jgi:hypothetical protein
MYRYRLGKRQNKQGKYFRRNRIILRRTILLDVKETAVRSTVELRIRIYCSGNICNARTIGCINLSGPEYARIYQD